MSFLLKKNVFFNCFSYILLNNCFLLFEAVICYLLLLFEMLNYFQQLFLKTLIENAFAPSGIAIRGSRGKTNQGPWLLVAAPLVLNKKVLIFETVIV